MSSLVLQKSMLTNASSIVVLDANIWVAEQMLRSSLGAAMLYALVERGTKIALPEVVELEVNEVLRRRFVKEVEVLEKSARWLHQNTGRDVPLMKPTAAAAQAGFAARWNELEGILLRVPWSLEHVQPALQKIIAKQPPCGPNNEQFRDCCLWEAALEIAEHREVHIVSSDKAFYEPPAYALGFAGNLQAEAETAGRVLHLHRNLDELLKSFGVPSEKIDENELKDAVKGPIFENSTEALASSGLTPRSLISLDISGYSTPEADTIAVSFVARFEAHQSAKSHENSLRIFADVRGSLSWHPKERSITNLKERWESSYVEGYDATIGNRLAKLGLSVQRLPPDYSFT